MSDVIKISKRPTNIVAYSEGASVFHTNEEQEKENYQIALHNQYTKGLADGQKTIKEKVEHEFNEKLLNKYAELNNLISDLNDKAVEQNTQFEEVVMSAAFILAGAILKEKLIENQYLKMF